MHYKNTNGLEWLCFNDDDRFLAGVSTRKGGFSTGEYGAMNLGINTKDDAQLVARNRELFFNTLAGGFKVAYLNQTHSADILSVDDENFASFADGDGLYTCKPNVLLSITIADCGSVLLVDEELRFCGAVHCGWRGTQAGIVLQLCNIAKQHSDAKNLKAYMGPMIQPQNYEVGEEFVSYFGSSYFHFSAGKRYFDLSKAVEDQLHDAGICSIENPKLDTFSDAEYYFSHRRNQQAGRMCAFIGLKKTE